MAFGQPDTSPVHEHGDLPERDRGNRDFVRPPRPFHLPAGVVSQSAIAQPEPWQGVGIEKNQWSLVFLPARAGLRLPGHVQGLVEITEDFELPSIDSEESVQFPATGDRPPRAW